VARVDLDRLDWLWPAVLVCALSVGLLMILRLLLFVVFFILSSIASTMDFDTYYGLDVPINRGTAEWVCK